MKILAKLTVLGLILFLSGCAHHYGSYARHSNGVFGISVDAQIPIGSYPSRRRHRQNVYQQRPIYRDDRYSQHDRRQHYNKHHYDKQYHDSYKSHRRHNQHYSDRRYDNHNRGHSRNRREKGRYNYWDGKRSRYETYNHRYTIIYGNYLSGFTTLFPRVSLP